MDFTYLHLFLLVNAFLVGILTTIAIQHARAHFRKTTEEESAPIIRPKTPKTDRLPQAMREKLLEISRVRYQSSLNRAISELEKNLALSTNQITKRLDKFGVEIVSSEMKRYKTTLDRLREKTEAEIGGAQLEVAKHQADIKAEMDKKRTEMQTNLANEINAKRQELISKIDTKLSDAVASFLVETMQHDIDLGAQMPYLLKSLENHKAELKKELSHES
jgi:hypothetical protein